MFKLYKLSKGSPNRWSKIDWNDNLDDDLEKPKIPSINIKQKCYKLKKQQDRLDLNMKRIAGKDYKRYPNKNIRDNKVEWISNNGIYDGKLLRSLNDAKYVCDTIGKCDGIIKDNNKGYYEVFRLKTKFSEANRHNKSCNIFIKNKFKLGKYL